MEPRQTGHGSPFRLDCEGVGCPESKTYESRSIVPEKKSQPPLYPGRKRSHRSDDLAVKLEILVNLKQASGSANTCLNDNLVYSKRWLLLRDRKCFEEDKGHIIENFISNFRKKQSP
jgi:hypothetical protein